LRKIRSQRRPRDVKRATSNVTEVTLKVHGRPFKGQPLLPFDLGNRERSGDKLLLIDAFYSRPWIMVR
jgi:hypothetical protein